MDPLLETDNANDSDFQELAVAAAIALFGFQSGAALSTVVGVLAEVPVMLSVMLSVVHLVRRSRGWYEELPGRACNAALPSRGHSSPRRSKLRALP